MSISVNRFHSPFIDENTYIIIDDKSGDAAVIDPGIYSDETASILEGHNLRYILLTHSHGDHIKDTLKYKEHYPEAQICVNKDEAEFLMNAELNGTAHMPMENLNIKADVLTDSNMTLKFGDEDIEFIDTPGHSPGGQCIKIGNILFSGDTLFYMSVGATHFVGGDWDALKKSITDKLFTLSDDVRVYPGHGPETSIGYEKRANPFV